MDPVKDFDNPLQDLNIEKDAKHEFASNGVDWFRTHPYVSALGGAGVLLIVGAFIVAGRASVQPQTSETRAWGGVGGDFSNPISDIRPGIAENAPEEDIMRQVQTGPPFFYTPPVQDGAETTDANGDGFDFNALIAALSKPRAAGTGAQQNDSLLADAFSFIPQGLISTSTPTRQRTLSQETLYQYGNEAGSYIQTFEDAHRNMPQTLKDQIEDPQNPAKVAALNGVGSGLTGIGSALEAMENVPSSAAAAHGNLAKSYQEIGKKLLEVPKAQGDEQRIEIMLAYNASVEMFVKNYVALATIFSLFDVAFPPNEPGSVFMFTQASF